MIFFEVMDIESPTAEPFAVMRIDTERVRGNGCEATVESLHWSRSEAHEVAKALRERREMGGVIHG